jgi:two-component system sensor histidine kinase KdpD
VSHNLRTPLAAIKAAAGTLLSPHVELGEGERRELLDTVRAEADRLERLVVKVLDLSRVRSGALELDVAPVDVADLARTAVRQVRPLAGAHRLRLDVPVTLPELRVDATMMEQAFGNLLENALRQAPQGSEIVLAARRVDGAVEVRVSDHGPGIPPEHRERVFEEFQRADGHPGAAGTGLGLAIVRAVVTGHGGEVWYEETPGGGATMALRVPLRAGR